MKKKIPSYVIIFLLLALAFLRVTGFAPLDFSDEAPSTPTVLPVAVAPADTLCPESEATTEVREDGWYYSKEEVALYIHTFGCLPDNYVSKREAEAAGWSGGSVEQYLPDHAIGGSRFGNYERLLPDKAGRIWTECDINTHGKSSRGPERLVFSNDGLIYYTPDHYESFELLYPDK